jgi:hypothetical protein
MRTSYFRLWPRSAELLISSYTIGKLSDEDCMKRKTVTLCYEVKLLPQIKFHHAVPEEMMPLKLYVNTYENDPNYCNILGREYFINTNQFQFDQLLTAFHNDRLPSFIEIKTDREIDIEDPDENDLEDMPMHSCTFTFGTKEDE